MSRDHVVQQLTPIPEVGRTESSNRQREIDKPFCRSALKNSQRAGHLKTLSARLYNACPIVHQDEAGVGCFGEYNGGQLSFPNPGTRANFIVWHRLYTQPGRR